MENSKISNLSFKHPKGKKMLFEAHFYMLCPMLILKAQFWH